MKLPTLIAGLFFVTANLYAQQESREALLKKDSKLPSEMNSEENLEDLFSDNSQKTSKKPPVTARLFSDEDILLMSRTYDESWNLIRTNSMLHAYSAKIRFEKAETKKDKVYYSYKVYCYYSKVIASDKHTLMLDKSDALNAELTKSIKAGGSTNRYFMFANIDKKHEIYNIKLYSVDKLFKKTMYSSDNLLVYLSRERSGVDFNIAHNLLALQLNNKLNDHTFMLNYFQDLVDMGYDKMKKKYPYSAPIIKKRFDEENKKGGRVTVKDGKVDVEPME